MIFALSFIIITIFGIILIFSSKRFSPIPYFPSQKQDIPLIVKALGLKNKQTIIDLGAGDGVVIFSAAKTALDKKLNTEFIAVEMNPILILILHIIRLLHPNKKNIKIIRDDIFKMDYNTVIVNEQSERGNLVKLRLLRRKAPRNDNQTMKQFNHVKCDIRNLTIYLYISPWFLEKVIENCKLALSEIEEVKIENFSVVSYMYPIKSLKKKERKILGKNTIFIYR